MTPSGMREVRCPHCRRLLCHGDWPAGTRSRFHCRDCKTVSVVEVASVAGPGRLIESVHVLSRTLARRA